MSISPAFSVLPSREIRTELPKALERFRREGISSAPIVFGAHRKPEAVVIPFELYASLLPLIEDLEIAQLVRERTAAGPATALDETAVEAVAIGERRGLDAHVRAAKNLGRL